MIGMMVSAQQCVRLARQAGVLLQHSRDKGA